MTIKNKLNFREGKFLKYFCFNARYKHNNKSHYTCIQNYSVHCDL